MLEIIGVEALIRWHHPHRVVSPLEFIPFQDEGIVRLVGNVLSELDFPANRMELEITESMAMYKVEQVIEKLQAFKEMGLSLALDDSAPDTRRLVTCIGSRLIR